jgi:hypothetical protein
MYLAGGARVSRGSPDDIRAVAFKIENNQVTLVPRQEANTTATFQRAQCDKPGTDCYVYNKTQEKGSSGAKRFLDFFFSKDYEEIKTKLEELEKQRELLLQPNKVEEVDSAGVEQAIYDKAYPQEDKQIVEGVNNYNKELKEIKEADLYDFEEWGGPLLQKLENARGLRYIPPLPRTPVPSTVEKPPSSVGQPPYQKSSPLKKTSPYKTQTDDAAAQKSIVQLLTPDLGTAESSPNTARTATSSISSASTPLPSSRSSSSDSSSRKMPDKSKNGTQVLTPPKRFDNAASSSKRNGTQNRRQAASPVTRLDTKPQKTPSGSRGTVSPPPAKSDKFTRHRNTKPLPTVPRSNGPRQIQVEEAPPRPEDITQEPPVDTELTRINLEKTKNNIYAFLKDYITYSLDKSYFTEAKNIRWDINDIVIVEYNGRYVFGIVNKVDGNSITVLVYETSDEKVVKIVTGKTYIFKYLFKNDPTQITDKILYDIFKKVTNTDGPFNYFGSINYNKISNKKDLYNKKLIEPITGAGGRRTFTRRRKILRRKTGKRR